jgi:DNA-binding NarL/FixJ family response regulator
MSASLGGYLADNKQMLEWHRQYVRQARELLGRRAFEATDYGRGLAADQVIDYALGETTAAKDATPNPWGDLPLTPREREIAQLVAAGKTNKDIAADLVIAHRTVDTHIENILTKMGFTSRTQIRPTAAISDGPSAG